MSASEKLAALLGLQRGVHPPQCKYSAECPTVDMPRSPLLRVSMQQHVGAPCQPLVKKGDRVAIGQPIGDSSAPVSAPIHAGASGVVRGFGEITLANGARVMTVDIENDGDGRVWSGVEPPHVHSRDDLVTAVRASGLVGLGGAGFPTHIKYALYKDGMIDTLVINGAECEPYITADYRECLENTWDIMNGILVTADHFGAHRTVIAVEDNKPKAIEELRRVAETCCTAGHRIEVLSVPAMYPQGAEKMIVQRATGRKIPAGKLPSDVGVCVMNITSTAFVSRYLKDGMPLVARRITVDGNAVPKPQNLRVTIGTPIYDVIGFAGALDRAIDHIVLGGPMMGSSVYTDEQPIQKQNNALLLFCGSLSDDPPETPCIRCGRCVSSCPMHLAPTALYNAYLRHDVAELQQKNVMSCVECGCCSYICPAKRQLTQMMRLAKNLVRREGKRS